MTIFFNYCFDKRRFSNFLQWFFRKSGHKKLLQLLEKLKFVGFHSATEAGFSISIDDLKIPDLKSTILLNGASEIKDLTPIENYQKIIELWNFTNETLKSQVLQSFQISDFLNPVYLMAFSGARGNISQIRQLVGMRGLMADPQGQIIDFPIRSNFREGLTLTEYLISCSGARKGIVDTALRTAASGYLTRRLVDIAHHAIISQIDCKSEKGFLLESLYDQKKKILSLEQRLIGRILAETIVIPGARGANRAIGKKNQEITPWKSIQICNYRTKVLIRSPLTCLSSKFICQLCYGWNLAEGQLVSIGEAVGILAAQSIGEPGTQLTMRTFHTGGVFTGTIIDQTYSPSAGRVTYPLPSSGLLIRTQQGQIAYLTKNSGTLKIQQSFKQFSSNLKRLLYLNAGELGSIRGKNPFLINIFQTMENEKQKTNFFVFQSSTVLYVRQGEQIRKNQLLAEVPFFSLNRGFEKEQEVLARTSGEIYFENVVFFEKTTFDLSKYLIQNLSEFWILFGQITSTNKFFFKKLDLITGYLPFNQIELPYIEVFYSSIHRREGAYTPTGVHSQRGVCGEGVCVYFKKISYTSPLCSAGSGAAPALWGSTPTGVQLASPAPKGSSALQGSARGEGSATQGSARFPRAVGASAALRRAPRAEPCARQMAAEGEQSEQTCSRRGKYYIWYSYFFVNRQGFFKKKCIKNFSILSRSFLKVHTSMQYTALFVWGPQILQNWSNNWLRIQKKSQPKIVHWKNIPLQKYLFIINFLQNNVFPNIQPSNIKTRIPSKKFGFYSFIRIPIHYTALYKGKKITAVQCIEVFDSSISNFFIEIQYPHHRKGLSPAARRAAVSSVFEGLLPSPPKAPAARASRAGSELPWPHPRRGAGVQQPLGAGEASVQGPSLRCVKKNFQNTYTPQSPGELRSAPSPRAEPCSPPGCSAEPSRRLRALLSEREWNFWSSQLRSGSSVVSKVSKNVLKVYFEIYTSLLRSKCGQINHQMRFLQIKPKKSIQMHFYTPLPPLGAGRGPKRADLHPRTAGAASLLAERPEGPSPLGRVRSRVQKKNPSLLPLPSSGTLQRRVGLKRLSLPEFGVPKTFQIIQRDFLRSRKIQILVRFLKYFQNSEILDLRISQNNFLFSTLSDFFSHFTTCKGSALQPGGLQGSALGARLRAAEGQQLGSLIRDPRGGQKIAQIKNISLYRKATNYLLNNQSILYGQYGDLISKNQRLCTVFYSQPKTGDIVQGIPKIEEILEVRKDTTWKGMFLLSRSFFETYLQNLQKSVLNNIQRIYGGQGIYISDKHIEIIVRQMTSNALILEPGQTGLLCGEIVALQWIERINLTLISNKVIYEPILMGMTQTCLEMSSFLSAASFQETTRVLSQAALLGRIDFIRGIKQNVILGNLIPIGTGCF